MKDEVLGGDARLARPPSRLAAGGGRALAVIANVIAYYDDASGQVIVAEQL